MPPFFFRRKGARARESAGGVRDDGPTPASPFGTGKAVLVLISCILLGVLAGVLFSRFLPKGVTSFMPPPPASKFPGLKRVESRPSKGGGGGGGAPGVAVGAAAAASSSLTCTPAQVAAHSTTQDALLAQLKPSSSSSGAAAAASCPSQAATHQAFMDLNRAGIPEPRELLNQVQELALNFGLSRGATLVHVGMDPQHPDFALVQSSFGASVGVGEYGDLEATLARVGGPAFVLFGEERTHPHCTPHPLLPTMVALLSPPSPWATLHAPHSVFLFMGTPHWYGPASPECATKDVCPPTLLHLSGALCALAPGMSQGVFRGLLRLTPAPPPPWAVAVPVPIPPAHMWAGYTLGGAIGVGHFYIQENVNVEEVRGVGIATVPRSGTTASEGHVVWTPEKIAYYEGLVRERRQAYYEKVDTRLYAVLDRHPIKGKTVVVMGSLEPMYEVVALAYGAASVTTVEYGSRECRDPRFEVITPAQLLASGRRFDVAISISSLEHDGLGRYGDALDPEGDLKAMAYLRDRVVVPGGALFLALPSGRDFLEFNAHRIYGKLRFPLLTQGWALEDSEEFSPAIWENHAGWQVQPVYYLTTPPITAGSAAGAGGAGGAGGRGGGK